MADGRDALAGPAVSTTNYCTAPIATTLMFSQRRGLNSCGDGVPY